MKKLTIKKFNGNDETSWAVFYAEDVKGLRSPIFSGDAKPIISDLDLFMARYNRDRLQRKLNQ